MSIVKYKPFYAGFSLLHIETCCTSKLLTLCQPFSLQLSGPDPAQYGVRYIMSVFSEFYFSFFSVCISTTLDGLLHIHLKVLHYSCSGKNQEKYLEVWHTSDFHALRSFQMFTGPLVEIKLCLLSTVLLSGFQAVPGKFSGSGRHSKCSCLQDQAS